MFYYVIRIFFLFFFFTSSSHALQEFRYYSYSGQCQLDYQANCSTYIAQLNANQAPYIFSQTGCTLSGSYTPLVSYTKTYTPVQTNPNNPPPSPVVINYSNQSAGSGLSKVCQDYEKLELNGCTATCVPDPCKQLEALNGTFTRLVTCGTATCQSPGVFSTSGGSMGCTVGRALFLPAPQSSATNPANSCSGSLVSDFVPSEPKVKPTADGQSSAQAYCAAQYKYSGSSGSPSSEEEGLVSLNYSGVTPTTENGQCPDNTTKGQLGENWVCVPDQPTNNTCPTGKIRDNAGNCVDPQNAGTCPTGQHRNADGACIADTPSNNNTGDTGGNTGGSTGGGGGGGSSGGNTGGSTGGGDSSTESHGSSTGSVGSGSASGAGGKTGAYAPSGCTTAPSCTGDPLQCAALESDWKRNCDNMSISQSSADSANAIAKASNDELTSAVAETEDKISSFMGDFTADTASVSSSSGSCPPDLHISVMSGSITIPFSQGCDFFRFLHLLIIMTAYLLAARIVFGGL